MKTMVTEITWVSLLGMINGAIVALGFHLALYQTFWEEQGAKLILPWIEVFAIIIGGWFW